jgi:hypothetical protein
VLIIGGPLEEIIAKTKGRIRYSLKGSPVVKNNLVRNLYAALKISIVTLIELYYGAYKSQKVMSNLGKIKRIALRIPLKSSSLVGSSLKSLQC